MLYIYYILYFYFELKIVNKFVNLQCFKIKEKLNYYIEKINIKNIGHVELLSRFTIK